MLSIPDHQQSIPQSAKFTAPGRIPASERIQPIRQTLIAELHSVAADNDLRLEPGDDDDERLLRSHDLTLPWLSDFVETSLKRAARGFSADLIGGANVTRLDRTITHGHPRLPYRKALRIVGSRGWRLSLGDELPLDAQASLVRFCGLLPVQIMYLPGQPGPREVSGPRQGLSYVLPWAGEAIGCEAPLTGDAGPSVCRFRIDRMLQFILGLDDVTAVKSAAFSGRA